MSERSAKVFLDARNLFIYRKFEKPTVENPLERENPAGQDDRARAKRSSTEDGPGPRMARGVHGSGEV